MQCKSIVLVQIALQIFSALQIEFLMLIYLEKEICHAYLRLVRVRCFCIP